VSPDFSGRLLRG